MKVYITQLILVGMKDHSIHTVTHVWKSRTAAISTWKETMEEYMPDHDDVEGLCEDLLSDWDEDTIEWSVVNPSHLRKGHIAEIRLEVKSI